MGIWTSSRGQLTADERELLGGLVRDMAPRVLAYIRRAYGPMPDAEDIVAETFSRAARNLAVLRNSERRDLYVLTIARNLCRDHYRRRRPVAVPDQRLDESPAPLAEPGRLLEQRELHSALRAAVAKLPDALREIVVLRLSGGLTFEQIAELLRIPLGTALSRMHTAIEQLRQTMGCVHEH